MTQNTAEKVDSGITFDDEVDNAINEDATEESAPQLDENPAVETPEGTETETKPEKHSDKFQDRINKVTADKYRESRRGDTAEARVVELEAQLAATKTPTREPQASDPDIDYDEDKLLQAKINYGVQQAVAETNKDTQQKDEQRRTEQSKADLTRKFTDNSAKFAADKPDFNDVLTRVPTLQPSVLDAVMERENGPELAYFLGKHLDIADQIIGMNPVAAGIKIGEISRKLAEPKQIKPSGAPDPINPIKAGGDLSSGERGPTGATFE